MHTNYRMLISCTHGILKSLTSLSCTVASVLIYNNEQREVMHCYTFQEVECLITAVKSVEPSKAIFRL